MNGTRLVAWLLLLPAALNGQKNAPKAPKPCTFDTAAHTDMLTVTFLVRAYRGDDSLPDAVLTGAFGDMIRPRFIAPSTIREMFFPNTYGRYDAKPMIVRSFGTLRMGTHGVAESVELQWDSPTRDTATGNEIIRALRAATAANEVADLATVVGGPALEHVRLTFGAGPDTGVRGPLLRLRVPMLVIESAPITRNGGARIPDGILGDVSVAVFMRYVIDESAHVFPGSAVADSASDLRFIPAAIEAVNSQDFVPAKTAGCPVKVQVEQVIRFRRTGS